MDKDSQDKILVRLLRRAGHDVITLNEVGLSGQQDPVVLDSARQTSALAVYF